MLNFDDPRSKLFFEFVRLVKEIQPKYFLLENVKMKKEEQNKISGYGTIIEKVGKNILGKYKISQANNQLSIVLHKSKEVNAETNNMQIEIQLDIYHQQENDYTPYSQGTSKLIYKIGFSIVRLVPVQTIYTGVDSIYSGLTESKEIKITNGSSFTIEYQTRYIPIAFPKGTNVMKWSLNTKGYSYYIDSLGNYMTLDSSGKVISISPTLTLDPNEKEKICCT